MIDVQTLREDNARLSEEVARLEESLTETLMPRYVVGHAGAQPLVPHSSDRGGGRWVSDGGDGWSDVVAATTGLAGGGLTSRDLRGDERTVRAPVRWDDGGGGAPGDEEGYGDEVRVGRAHSRTRDEVCVMSCWGHAVTCAVQEDRDDNGAGYGVSRSAPVLGGTPAPRPRVPPPPPVEYGARGRGSDGGMQNGFGGGSVGGGGSRMAAGGGALAHASSAPAAPLGGPSGPPVSSAPPRKTARAPPSPAPRPAPDMARSRRGHHETSGPAEPTTPSEFSAGGGGGGGSSGDESGSEGDLDGATFAAAVVRAAAPSQRSQARAGRNPVGAKAHDVGDFAPALSAGRRSDDVLAHSALGGIRRGGDTRAPGIGAPAQRSARLPPRTPGRGGDNIMGGGDDAPIARALENTRLALRTALDAISQSWADSPSHARVT